MQSDYRQLLQKGVESDACLVVSGKEFPVHRCVLRSRSTVFEAMFSHETTEKESGRVLINDLDPESFGDFLEYLYTGSVGDDLSDDNVFGLYAAADKYDLSTLKSECVSHMRRTLSVDSFCDVMNVALRHREKYLLQSAVNFFKENLSRIIVTSKWQQFLEDNSTSANELLIKALGAEGK